jgi:hypothetical protein
METSGPVQGLRCLYIYYSVADKSLARPTSRCILFDGENISFDASLVIIYIYFFFFTGATTHCGFVFCSPLAGYSLLAYEVS